MPPTKRSTCFENWPTRCLIPPLTILISAAPSTNVLRPRCCAGQPQNPIALCAHWMTTIAISSRRAMAKPRQDILSTSAELTGSDATLSLPQTSPLRGCERVVCNSLFIWALFLKHNILAISVVFSCPSGVRGRGGFATRGPPDVLHFPCTQALPERLLIPWKGWSRA